MPEVNKSLGVSSCASMMCEAADHIRDEPAHLLEIADVIARQLRIHVRQLGRAHRDVAIVELFCR